MIKKGYWYGFLFSVIAYAGMTLVGRGDIGTLLVTGPLLGLIVFGMIGAVVRWVPPG